MAIYINSKHIFQAQNSKIRDNFVDRLEIGAISVEPSEGYDVSVCGSSARSFTDANLTEDYSASGIYRTEGNTIIGQINSACAVIFC